MSKAPPPPQFRTRRGNGDTVLVGVDGRSMMARRFREITAEISADIGGDTTEAQRHLIARAATLACWCEARETELAQGQPFDASQYSAVTNTLRRLLNDIGLERSARDITPTLNDFLAAREAGQ